MNYLNISSMPAPLPLTAIRVFDVFARTGNFTRAAEQLNMTQAAVSYHIQQLERFLSTSLFIRLARGVSLTLAGEKLAPLIQSTLTQLSQGLEAFKQDQLDCLTIATIQTFASCWLAPRLSDFHLKHPELTVRIKIINPQHKIDLARENVDILIRCGEANWPNAISDFLMTQSFTPICSPDYLKHHPQPLTPADILNHTLIAPNDDWWKFWFSAAGLSSTTLITKPGIDVETQMMAASLALSDSGIALLSPHFYHQELLNGRLVSLFEISASSGNDYYLSRLANDTPPPKIIAFYNWIRAEIDHHDQTA